MCGGGGGLTWRKWPENGGSHRRRRSTARVDEALGGGSGGAVRVDKERDGGDEDECECVEWSIECQKFWQKPLSARGNDLWYRF